MNELDREFKKLSINCKTIADASLDAQSWIGRNINVKEIKRNAKVTTNELINIHTHATKMMKACNKKCGIGIFGESQAGKSYLVSSIAGDSSNCLLTQFDNNSYDFIKDINPNGGGKESTAVVTRFTKELDVHTPDDYPVKLQLLKESEIAMIFINSYYEDFRDNGENFSDEDVHDQIFKLENVSQSERASNLINIDEIVNLRDYINNNHPALFKKLGDDYWAIAYNKFKKLSLDERTEFYSFMWGRSQLFTKLFKYLSLFLQDINDQDVYAQLEALIPPKNTKQHSIINVDALNNIYEKNNTTSIKTSKGTKIIVPIGVLTALTSELYITVSHCKNDQILSQMDLLDFPGYRGRLKKDRNEIQTDNCDTLISTCFLRGKVAYLFEKYVNNLEINCLIVCCASNEQINSDIERVITRWIEQTQGKNVEERSKHNPGLFWALTKFDVRITQDLDKNPKYGNDGLLHQTLLEKFGGSEWLTHWSKSNNKELPFNNIFLVRKPGTSGFTCIETKNNNEIQLRKENEDKLNEFKKIFINDPTVNTYFCDPSEAWDAMLELNDGGIKRLCKSIAETDAKEIRFNALTESLKHECAKANSLLSKWFESDDLQNKQELATKHINTILGEFQKIGSLFDRFGEFLNYCIIPNKIIRDVIYYKEQYDEDLNNANCDVEHQDNNVSTPVINNENSDLIEINTFYDEIDYNAIFEKKTKNDASHAMISSEHAEQATKDINAAKLNMVSLGEKIYFKWISHLRNLAMNDGIPTFKVDPTVIDIIVNEIICCANRNDSLKNELINAIKDIENKGERQDAKYCMAVGATQTIISDFLSKLDNEKMLQKKCSDENLPPTLPEDKPEKNKMPGRKFCKNWLKTFCNTIKYNVNYSLNVGTTPAENEKLGKILQSIYNIEG